ncbi:MAG: hypothetical protein RB292_00190 [Patescibacteria group bacterium]|nr:hypothetical protein [Patescibacteria group bacterium]
MFSFVLANFRVAGSSGQLEIALKEVLASINGVKGSTLGGRVMADGDFPEGGYAVHLEKGTSDSNKVFSYAVLDPENNGLAEGQVLTGGQVVLTNVQVAELCGLAQSTVTNLPCQGLEWQDAGNYLEIIFVSPELIAVNHQLGSGFRTVGGVLEHQKTGQRVYFYVSLDSGLIVGDNL